MKRITGLFLCPALTFLLAFTTADQAPVAGDQTKIITVTESDISRQAAGSLPANVWVAYTRQAGSIAFVQDYAAPPLGCGSVQFSTPAAADKAWLFNYLYLGTRLADIRALSYATYIAATDPERPNQVAALNLEIDYNGLSVWGGYTVLVFEPVYNPDQGTLAPHRWQTWDALHGGQARWRSTRRIPGLCAADCLVTWEAILAAYPRARIIGGVGINQGAGNPGLTSAVDAFTIGVRGHQVRYNFEQTAGQRLVAETDIARQPEGTLPTKSWTAYQRQAGELAFVRGPGAAPQGCGSVQFSTPDAADKAWLFNYDYVGTPLSAVRGLFYSTYKTAGLPAQVAALNVEVDYNGPGSPGGYTVLVFEPVYNPSQGTVTENTWQSWDAYHQGQAIWWSTETIPGLTAYTAYVTWDHILAHNPDATILGGVGINQGTGNPGLVSAVDALSICAGGSNKIFDFEDSSPTTYFTYFRDSDQDGYGNPLYPRKFCAASPPAGYVTNNYDCNDWDGKKKVLICHRGLPRCVDESSLQAHLAHGDQLGLCGSTDQPEAAPALTQGRQVLAFPNPTRGKLQVQLPGGHFAPAEITITRANGTVVATSKQAAPGLAATFDLSGQGPGLYFIKVQTPQGVLHSKVLVRP